MRKEKAEHESKVCGFIASVIHKRRGEEIVLKSEPDKSDRVNKAVEFVWKSPSSDYVVEHTRIETYPKQIEDNHRFNQLMGPLESKFQGKLPSPGYYQLGIPIKASLTSMNIDAIRDKITVWVKNKASDLALGKRIVEIPDGVPFQVSLSRQEAVVEAIKGRCLIHRYFTGDLQINRRERIQEALSKKCPKLHSAKLGIGKSRSVLVLESDDIALANHHDIADVLIPELLNRKKDIPDEVYLAETELKEQPVIWVIKEGDALFSKIKHPGPYYFDKLGNYIQNPN